MRSNVFFIKILIQRNSIEQRTIFSIFYEYILSYRNLNKNDCNTQPSFKKMEVNTNLIKTY